MNGFEHSIMIAQVRTAGGADTALNLGGFIGQDVAVEIGEDEDLKAVSDGGIQQIGSHNVDVPVIDFDFREGLCLLVDQA